MTRLQTGLRLWAAGGCLACSWALGAAEWNPLPTPPPALGPEAGRFVVGFKATPANALTTLVQVRSKVQAVRITQAGTDAADAAALAQRSALALRASRQLTPSMHVLVLGKILYGADVAAALQRLRADPAVAFADVDERRYPHAIPNDPLFQPVAGSSSGQWYLLTPTPSGDAAATDAVSAWNITQGSSGTVIADVDSGILFDHPDLKRAGFGGRLLPGYDFVSADSGGTTFLAANDSDGWDPDPSDPGDWISSTDQMNTSVFPSSRCSVEPSSWHGTRVTGVLGATTNNSAGIAGMTWNPYMLPVRALGKCGGFDSDILAGMQWAAGLSVSGVPDNPYPADIINLSLGGTGACPSDYQSVVSTLTGMGVLIIASAGNASGPVDAPGNCPGVLAVAGLRNVGTKVGYSSLGPEVGIAAPAGNCINSAGACLRSIDTTSNDGTTVPGDNTYTNETNVNLGTSFSAPIVSGVAALMRAANANLTPAQLIARMQSSATEFPQSAGVPQCPAVSSSGECACVVGQCGAGMVNALSAVMAALRPIAAIKLPAGLTSGGTAQFDASGSAAACKASVAKYQWTASGGVTISSAAGAAQVTASWSGAIGTLTLVITDSAGATDTATVNFSQGGGATTTAPASAGSSASACIADMKVTPVAPTLSESFAPASVAPNATALLTIMLTNANGYDLTQSSLAASMPAGLSVDINAPLATTCTGASLSLVGTTGEVTLSNANIPAKGSCTVTSSVMSTVAGSYMATLGAGALMTAPAGGNTDTASASLTVSAPSSGKSGGGGGGGALEWTDLLLALGVVLACRGHAVRRRGP